MKLLSVTIRNYRILGNLTVDFDPARTLIGGPNETGKSTLIEAIHRALFLKSKVTGEGQADMISTRFPGHPEVEVSLEVQGKEYRVTKRFAGANGTTQLTQVGGETWQGKNAENQLAQLLGVEGISGGRGILDRVRQQWAHLWVWQGSSGKDPSDDANSQQANLLMQLQNIGGAVAVQSDLDGRVAARFAELKSEIYVRSGTPKKGSELAEANSEFATAKSRRDEALERRDRLDQAVQSHEDASDTIQRITIDLVALREQHEEVSGSLASVSQLQSVEQDQVVARSAAVDEQEKLDEIETNIAEKREAARMLRESLDPRRDEEAGLDAAAVDARKLSGNAEQDYDNAVTASREVRLRRDLALAHVSQFEKAAYYKKLLARADRVAKLDTAITDIGGQLAEVVEIDQDDLETLQNLENDYEKASASLDAMAAEIEVISSAHSVRVGNTDLPVGKTLTLTEPSEVAIGDSILLKINPGGGKNLSNARELVKTLRTRLQRSLDDLGLQSVAKAAAVVAKRNEFNSKLNEAKSARAEQGSDDLIAASNLAKEDLTAATSNVIRRQQQVADITAPLTLADSESWRDREDAALETAERVETEKLASRDALKAELVRREETLTALGDAIVEDKQELTGFDAQIKLLIDNHGDDESRRLALDLAREARVESEKVLTQTKEDIAALQPDLLSTDEKRLQRAITKSEDQKQAAKTQLAVSISALQLDGTVDPKGALATVEANLEAASEHLAAVRRKASAIALVDSLFQDEQKALSDLFSQPLATKISDYLQTLFGPSAQAVVTFEDNSIKGIELVRSTDEGATSFESLSGGTKEQLSAAVRLAVTELLAADHDHSLPIVFDDAFAYSDPERVNTLQRMLDLGASRGLQVIVLSCNPSDYASLGAKHVTLAPVDASG